MHSLLNTFQFTLEAAIPVLGLSLLLAVLLNRPMRLSTFLRSAFYFPQTLSVVTLGLVWVWMLDPLVGPINYYLRSFGLSPPVWLGDPSTAMWSIVMTVVWGAAGDYMVIYLAGLQDIPRTLYEAAAIDGAGPLRSFWSITVPLLRRVFLLVGVVHVIGAFQIFGQVLVPPVEGRPTRRAQSSSTSTTPASRASSRLARPRRCRWSSLSSSSPSRSPSSVSNAEARTSR